MTKQDMNDVSSCIHKEASLEKQDVYVSVTRIKSIVSKARNLER